MEKDYKEIIEKIKYLEDEQKRFKKEIKDILEILTLKIQAIENNIY